MKMRGPMAVAALVLGLAAFELGWGSDGASNGASAASFMTPEEVGALAADTIDEIGGSDVADASDGSDDGDPAFRAEDDDRFEDDDDDDDRRRRWWRYRRNVWDGPIPTPAEWAPPEGPVRIALQAGHWKKEEAPDELRRIRDNGTAARGVAEWEANLAIAESAAGMLEELGYVVDILPAVVPQSYRAHLFISIHADGSNDPDAHGYRVGIPRRDQTGRADDFARILEAAYGQATGIRHLTSTTRRMRNYYAFNFRRYEHALHPHTIAVILETGFLTSPRDWETIVEDPDRSARGIVEAVTAYQVTAAPALAARGTIGGESGGD